MGKKEMYVVALPNGEYLDKDGRETGFFFAMIFDDEASAHQHATDNLFEGTYFEVRKLHQA